MCKSVIVQLFRYAVMQGDIDISPATEVELPRGLPKKAREALTVEQIKIVTECRTGDWWLLGLALLWTGCRRGEALAVQFKDIDRERKLLRISKSVYYDGTPKIKEPKTESGIRTVALPDVLLDVLPKGKPNHYLFGGERLLTMYEDIKGWEKYQKETGLTITPHMIRHGYATMLHSAGVDAKEAQALLGHSNISTTMDVYTHVTSEQLDIALKKINSYAKSSYEIK